MIASTDCGFSQEQFNRRVHPSIMWAKLEAMAEGEARIASEELWGRKWRKRGNQRVFLTTKERVGSTFPVGNKFAGKWRGSAANSIPRLKSESPF